MILPIYQPLGSSSHQIAHGLGIKYQEKATHTGTLDPMAEGVLIVLTGEDRFQKSVYSKWPKVYRFSLLWGLQTDTDDSLGIIMQTQTPTDITPVLHSVTVNIPTFQGNQLQKVHPFSARRWKGSSSFEYARRQEKIPIHQRAITINHLEMQKTMTLSQAEVHREWNRRLDLMSQGDWRQEEIKASWSQVWGKIPELLWLTFFEVHCSHGTYVRQLARDLSSQSNTPAIVWNLQRTQNGIYKTKDCKNNSK